MEDNIEKEIISKQEMSEIVCETIECSINHENDYTNLFDNLYTTFNEFSNFDKRLDKLAKKFNEQYAVIVNWEFKSPKNDGPCSSFVNNVNYYRKCAELLLITIEIYLATTDLSNEMQWEIRASGIYEKLKNTTYKSTYYDNRNKELNVVDDNDHFVYFTELVHSIKNSKDLKNEEANSIDIDILINNLNLTPNNNCGKRFRR